MVQPRALQRAVFSRNLICNLINMFTEGENIIKYYFKTLRGCDTVHNSDVNRFVGCVCSQEERAVFGRGGSLCSGCQGWAEPLLCSPSTVWDALALPQACGQAVPSNVTDGEPSFIPSLSVLSHEIFF